MTPPKLKLTGGWVDGIPHHSTPNQNPGMHVPASVLGVVMHTMVGNLPGTDSWFMNPAAQASAHFGVGQDGSIIQWVNVSGGIAWHCAAGNPSWYGIEHADDGNPANPLTPAQINASAQLVELLSRDSVGRFPLNVCNSTGGLGYGVHNMGGASWGGHSCPGPGPRAGQRSDILAIAKQIRSGSSGSSGPAAPHLGDENMPLLLQWDTDGTCPISIPDAYADGKGKIRVTAKNPNTIRCDWTDAPSGEWPTTVANVSYGQPNNFPIPQGCNAAVLHRDSGAGLVSVSLDHP